MLLLADGWSATRVPLAPRIARSFAVTAGPGSRFLVLGLAHVRRHRRRASAMLVPLAMFVHRRRVLRSHLAVKCSVHATAVLFLTFSPVLVEGQTPRTGRRADSVARDTIRTLRIGRDSLRRDTTHKELVEWQEADSVARALLERPGFTATRYQGERVIFDARTRTLRLEGTPSAVTRGQTVVVGDTIFYSDSTQIVRVFGDTNILRDPAQGEDVVTRGSLVYDIGRGRGAVTNVSTAVTSGERWIVHGGRGLFQRDTAGTRFYVHGGRFTTCDEEVPHYHFRSSEIKLLSRTLIVARPAVLYIGEVPVMWLPFVFQDLRSGRRSGLLSPRFGVSELVRSGSMYRRHVDNIGYYFALSDYMDAQLWLDWRSGARGTPEDPGWTKWNGEFRYRWLNRFMTGRFATSHTSDQNGSTNTALSWAHQQSFSQTRSFSANVNYVTNTSLQRQNAFDPRQVLATINSQASYQQKIGPASLALGGNRTQYPGREQVLQTLPTLSLATPTLALAKWLEWTPSLNLNNQQALNLDQAGTVGFRYLTREDGTVDSVLVRGDRRNTTASFNTPLKIFGFTWNNSFAATDTEDNYPTSVVIVDPDDPSRRDTRVFARTFQTGVDWQTSISLPPLLSGSWNVAPSVGIQNVEASSPFWVRTQFTGGRFITQSKRLNYSLGVSPTFFALLPGIGPLTRLRHSLAPRLTYGYSPRAEVDREFLRATNRTPNDYLGGLAQNQISLHLSHVLEGKVRDDRDSSTAHTGRKLRLLSMNFSPLTYDFERKRATGKSGFTTTHFGYDVASDLLPGLALRVGYSLFQGSPLSDTAVFKPFREDISASFSINQQSEIFGAIARIFGRAVQQPTPQVERLEASPDDALAQRIASTPVAGSTRRDREFGIPVTRGWQASFVFSSNRQRPPVGGRIIDFDPAEVCRSFIANPIIHNQCLIDAQTRPTGAVPFAQVVGAPFIRTPPRETLQWNTNFNITPAWSTVWGTTYDFREKEFASHHVTLQRQLHDWRAIWGFTKAPNGNFAFTFFIQLNAQPDLKFNYDQQTYRPLTP